MKNNEIYNIYSINNSLPQASIKTPGVKMLINPGTTVATPDISRAIQMIKDISIEEKALAYNKKAWEKVIKDYMQDNDHLLDKNGALAVTWIQGKDVTKLNIEALKQHFNDVYLACSEIEKGSRRFLVK